jgi:cytochrome d ubiquinol oxidase subunit I
MALAAFITTCLVIGGVSAGYLLKGTHVDAAKKMLRMAVLFAGITVPLQIFVGDLHGLQVGETQPTKLAAMEGHWEPAKPGAGVPLVVFGMPNQKAERNDYEVAIPRLGSLILTHSWDGDIQSLKSVAPEDRPPVAPVFWAFRVMVGLGMLMLLMSALSLWTLWKKRLFESRPLLRFWRLMMFAGFVSLLSGWYVAEIGRQPWVIYGLLRTADAVSPAVEASSVIASLVAFASVYAIVFGAGIWYLVKLVKKGPVPHDDGPSGDEGERRPMRPLSVGTPFDGEDIREAN